MTNAAATTAFRTHHGAPETNGLINGAAYHDSVDYTGRPYTLAELQAAGGRISRLRLLTETVPGTGRFVDVSYIHATLPDGRTVTVQNGLDNMTPMRLLKSKMIDWAKREGVFAKSIGLLDEGKWSSC